jgi:hypothetical protein
MPEIITLMKSIDLKLLIILLLPGFISFKIWRFLYATRVKNTSEIWLEILFFGSINYVFLFLLLKNDNTYVFLILNIILPFLYPIILKFILSLDWIKSKILNPIPTSWDYFFGLRKTCFILVHLKTGESIGGYYGENSFASSYPQQDLYLEEVWQLNEDLEFIEKIPYTEGLIINCNDIKFIEIFNDNDAKGGI